MENKFCQYCGEKMQFGVYPYIFTQKKRENWILYIRQIDYSQYGWKCGHQHKKCCIILDDRKTEVNVFKLKTAMEQIMHVKWINKTYEPPVLVL